MTFLKALSYVKEFIKNIFFLSFSRNLSEINAFEKIYMKYLEQLEKNGSEDGCPLCHRQFKSQRDLRNLMEELRMKMDSVPEKRTTFTNSLKEEKVLEKSVLDLMPEKNYVSQCDSSLLHSIIPSSRINSNHISLFCI